MNLHKNGLLVHKTQKAGGEVFRKSAIKKNKQKKQKIENKITNLKMLIIQ